MGRVLEPSVLYGSTAQVFRLWASDGYNLIEGLSLDGREWYYSEDPPLSLPSFLGVHFVYAVQVVKVPGGYYMDYTATPSTPQEISVGLAVSADGKGSILRLAWHLPRRQLASVGHEGMVWIAVRLKITLQD